MADHWRDDPRNRRDEDDRDRNYGGSAYSRYGDPYSGRGYAGMGRSGDYGRGAYGSTPYGSQSGRRDRDDDYASRGYNYGRGSARGDYAGSSQRDRGRWGRDQDYASGYRDDDRYRDREEYRDRDRDAYRGAYGDARGRDWVERASDEVASWFGDDEANRRRQRDELRDDEARGRRGYTRMGGHYRDDW